jgi:uncharacterized Fe-S cluster-containing radical SAM superfamily protein
MNTMETKLWNDRDSRVLLARLDESSMKNEARSNITVVEDYYRAKTYVKPGDMLLPLNGMPFTDPFMIAQSRVGGTWNDHNAPFSIQVAGCNASCPFCFVPRELRSFDESFSRWFSAREIVAIHDRKEPARKTIRISGGEPFLAPEFISAMADELKNRPDMFLWVDTNLLGNRYDDVVISLVHHVNDRFGICGCFKGFDAATFSTHSGLGPSRYDDQWNNAKALYRAMKSAGVQHNLFFYVPEIAFFKPGCAIRMEPVLESFASRLQATIHENAPLRVTILSLKEYDANRGWKESLARKLGDGHVMIEPGMTRNAWRKILDDRFPVESRWLPQYQVPI